METIDLVVHAAGTLGGTYARKQTFEQWQAIMSANLDSCFVVTSAVLPRMRAGSRFVFISSSAAHEPMMARTAYSASKAGMNAFARALALEVDRDGIAVHIVTPGPVETEMLQDVPFEMYAIQVSDVAEAVAWLDTVDPSVDLPEIRLTAVQRGPFARPPVVPTEARRRRAQANALITDSPNSCKRIRDGEIGEPHVETLDPLGGQAAKCAISSSASPQTSPGPRLPNRRVLTLAHLVRVAARPGEADHLLNRHPGASRRRGQLGQPVEVVRLQIPPIRVVTNEFHHPGSAATQNQRYRMGPFRQLSCAASSAAVTPVLPDQRQVTPELLDPGHRILLTDIESGELRGPGARTEAELESAVRRLRQGDGLFGEHGGMPKSVAEHQMADPQPLASWPPPRWQCPLPPKCFRRAARAPRGDR